MDSSISEINVGDIVIVTDRHCWYRDKTVAVLRDCGEKHHGLVVVGFKTLTGGSVEWVTHKSYLRKASA